MQAQRQILDLEDATVGLCGSKASACAELARVAQKQDSFQTPNGVCLAFGNMEYALQVRKNIQLWNNPGTVFIPSTAV